MAWPDYSVAPPVENSGDTPFLINPTGGHAGGPCYQAGPITDDQTTSATWVVPAGGGTATIWWTASSEYNWDWFFLYINGHLESQVSGPLNWHSITRELLGGDTIAVKYVKDSGGAEYADTAYFEIADWAPNASVTFSISNDGSGALSVSWTPADSETTIFSSIDGGDEVQVAVVPAGESSLMLRTATGGLLDEAHRYRYSDGNAHTIQLRALLSTGVSYALDSISVTLSSPHYPVIELALAAADEPWQAPQLTWTPPPGTVRAKIWIATDQETLLLQDMAAPGLIDQAVLPYQQALPTELRDGQSHDIRVITRSYS